MKNLLFIAAIAVAFASCTKNELAPSVEAQQEITFMTAPVTKALDPSGFKTTNHFTSWAYYTGDTDWAYPTSATNWINGAEIQYMTDKWKNSTQSYYWPKDDGKLTFFAFSDNTNDPALTNANVSCNSTTGVVISSFDVTKNVNVDLLVADPAKNQKANTSPATYLTTGVPTLFRHKLANVEFKIKYALPDDGVTDFTLTSIYLKGLNTTGTYTQNDGAVDDKVGKWELTANTADKILYTDQAADFTAAEVNLETSADQHYFMPQAFDGTQKIEVKYFAKGTGAGKTHTLEGDLQTIFGIDGWKIGKRYICTITIGADEILWDPAVENWENTSGFTADLN